MHRVAVCRVSCGSDTARAHGGTPRPVCLVQFLRNDKDSRRLSAANDRPTIVITMSVSASLPEVRTQRSPLIRILSVGGLILLLVIAGAAAWIYSIARSALP